MYRYSENLFVDDYTYFNLTSTTSTRLLSNSPEICSVWRNDSSPCCYSCSSLSLPPCQFVAGAADPLAANLIATTRACLDDAIALCKPGVPFSAVGAYIQPKAEAAGFSVVKQFCGHGIGHIFHMPPLVFHCRNTVDDLMQPGMTFTIEPLLNEGTPDIQILGDGWTYITTSVTDD